MIVPASPTAPDFTHSCPVGQSPFTTQALWQSPNVQVNPVAQSLRPFPQFSNIPVSGNPVGKTWYDSLQAKITKRYSHGLDIQATFTYQTELTIGAENSYPLGAAFGGGQGATVNDIYNYNSNKYLAAQSRPLQLVIAGNYITPA